MPTHPLHAGQRAGETSEALPQAGWPAVKQRQYRVPAAVPSGGWLRRLVLDSLPMHTHSHTGLRHGRCSASGQRVLAWGRCISAGATWWAMCAVPRGACIRSAQALNNNPRHTEAGGVPKHDPPHGAPAQRIRPDHAQPRQPQPRAATQATTRHAQPCKQRHSTQQPHAALWHTATHAQVRAARNQGVGTLPRDTAVQSTRNRTARNHPSRVQPQPARVDTKVRNHDARRSRNDTGTQSQTRTEQARGVPWGAACSSWRARRHRTVRPARFRDTGRGRAARAPSRRAPLRRPAVRREIHSPHALAAACTYCDAAGRWGATNSTAVP